MRRLAATLALFALSPLAAAASSDPDVAKAEQLLAKRQPNGAYELLSPLEDERGGNPDFDYVFGQAALDSGRASEAAFAFERCLAIDPKNGPCRVMMARAHLALGENNSARKELDTVQASQPPVEVENLVSQYLGALKQREAGERRRVGAWASAGLGYDGNVNSATADPSVVFPALPGMVWTLNAAGTRQNDNFIQGGAGASFSQKLSPSWQLLADASVNRRSYQDEDKYTNMVLDGGFGVAWNTGHNSVLLKLQQQGYYLDNDRYRNYTGLLTQYQYAASETSAFSAYLQDSQLDYRGKRADADRYTFGLGWSQGLSGSLSPVIYTGLYGGSEVADGNLPHLDQSFYGLRVGGSIGSRTLRYTGSLSVEQRKYDGPQPPVMVEPEKATQFDLSLGAIWQMDKHLSLRPTYTFTTNSSNNPLSDYDRHTVSVDVRFEL